MSKKGNKYIDYLDENGWHLVPNKVSRNKKNILQEMVGKF